MKHPVSINKDNVVATIVFSLLALLFAFWTPAIPRFGFALAVILAAVIGFLFGWSLAPLWSKLTIGAVTMLGFFCSLLRVSGTEDLAGRLGVLAASFSVCFITGIIVGLWKDKAATKSGRVLPDDA